MLNLRKRLCLAVGAALLIAGTAWSQNLPTLEKKDRYKVGFAQTESGNVWSSAQTRSMQNIAPICGWELVYTDAAGSAAKQASDVDSMISQGLDVIFLVPSEERALLPAVMGAKQAGIPVFLIDRSVDSNVAKAGEDYVTFIGSDFVDQGRRAAEWLVEATGGKGTIIELEGTTGSSPANDRKKGFDEVIAQHPEMKIVASQTGDFARDKGRTVMETLLQAHPDATAVYAHNDEMAIGAIQALEAAGRKPGQDVTVVSIDGAPGALQAILDGKMNASVGSSPLVGAIACETLKRYAAGEQIEPWVKVKDRIFTRDNAGPALECGKKDECDCGDGTCSPDCCK